ncbi:MAG TPA: hypothetical protein VE988_02435 [Gemmataceae bacterium]|nr:hypothetical protein [Gemmataceae bacterium]
MSFGYVMGQQPEPDKPRCASCGAQILSSAATHCWLCQEALGPGGQTGHSSGPSGRASGDNIAMAAIGGLIILLFAAMAMEAPGVLIILLVVATPALIRTLVVASRETGLAGWTLVGTFFSSLGVMAIVGTAAGAAFYATCFVVCLGALALNDAAHSRSYEWILIPSIGAGLVPGAMVFWWLIRLFWRRPQARNS